MGGAVEGSSAGSGAFEVDMKGRQTIGDEVELLVAGRFGGVEHDVRLWTEGDRLHAGPRGALTLDVPRPAELEAALVIERYDWLEPPPEDGPEDGPGEG